MNWLRKIMIGRHGVDELSLALLTLSIILTIVGVFPNTHMLSTLSLVLLFICYLRIFSRNHSKRYEENRKFLSLTNPVRIKIRNWSKRKQDKTHRYFRCPKCKKIVRVPKGKGKICITCPICKEEFVRKS